MCRLTAYLGRPIPAATLVFGGDHPLFEQSWRPQELLSGSVNADGYGVAWYGPDGGGDPGQPGRIVGERPIWSDEADLRQSLPLLRSRCIVAALRNGTPGIPLDRSGLLPMVDGRWTFALNGYVPDFRALRMRALRATLPDALYARLQGSSDSETLFLIALAALEGGADPAGALAEVVRRVADRVGGTEAQLNMLLTDGRTLAVVRAGTVASTNSLYLAEGHPLAPDGVLFASERLDGHESWRAVEPHHVIVVGPLATPQGVSAATSVSSISKIRIPSGPRTPSAR